MPAVITVFRFLRDVVQPFLRHGCPSLAASLAFFSLLSLFPLVFLLLYGVSFLVSQEVIGEQFLLSSLKGFLPSLGERLAEELHRISALDSVRWLVYLSFFWFGGLVFYELDYGLNVVFESTRRRHPLIPTAISVALLGANDFFRSEEIGLQSHPSNRRFLRGLFEFAGQSLGIAMREEYPVSSGGRTGRRKLRARPG